MPLFKYLAALPGESAREIQIEAENPTEALNKLRSRRLVPVRFFGETEPTPTGFLANRKKIDTYDFTVQLSPLLAANIPLERALGIIAEGCRNGDQKEFVNALRQGLHEGKKFSGLVRSYGKAFPGFYANLVESGEESGCLGEVVEELRKFMEENKEMREFIISSSIYPAVVFGVTILVSLLMFIVFIPRFSQIFLDMGRELPGSMVFLMSLSGFLQWAWWLVPLALYLVWRMCKWRFGEARLQEWRSRVLLTTPVLGPLVIQLELGKFIRTMAILISNHVEIIRTVKISTRVIQNRVLRSSFDSLEGRLKGGHKLSEGLHDNPYLPPGLTAKLRVGEESGSVGPMLTKSAEQLESGSRRQIKRLLSMFEPLVIVFLALVVMVVVVSIFLAIMEMNSAE